MDLYVNRYSIKYGFSWSEIMFKGSDWQCMVVENVVLLRILGFIWDMLNVIMMNNYWVLSTFKILHLGGYVLRIDFLSLKNDDKNVKKKSTVNWLVVKISQFSQ